MLTGIGFSQQVAGGIINIFSDDSVSCGLNAVADAVVDITAGSLADQPMGVVVGIGGPALSLELAFVVVAVNGVGRAVELGVGELVFLRIIAVIEVLVNQLFRQFELGNHGLGAVAIGIKAVLVTVQRLGTDALAELGQPSSVIVVIGGGFA